MGEITADGAVHESPTDFDWLSCSNCRSPYLSTTPFYLTSCTHIICSLNTCLLSPSPNLSSCVCPICRAPTSLLALDLTPGALPNDLERLFRPVENEVESLGMGIKFQMGHLQEGLEWWKGKCEKQKEVLRGLSKELKVLRDVRSRNEALESENLQLRQQLAQLRGTAPTPALSTTAHNQKKRPLPPSPTHSQSSGAGSGRQFLAPSRLSLEPNQSKQYMERKVQQEQSGSVAGRQQMGDGGGGKGMSNSNMNSGDRQGGQQRPELRTKNLKETLANFVHDPQKRQQPTPQPRPATSNMVASSSRQPLGQPIQSALRQTRTHSHQLQDFPPMPRQQQQHNPQYKYSKSAPDYQSPNLHDQEVNYSNSEQDPQFYYQPSSQIGGQPQEYAQDYLQPPQAQSQQDISAPSRSSFRPAASNSTTQHPVQQNSQYRQTFRNQSTPILPNRFNDSSGRGTPRPQSVASGRTVPGGFGAGTRQRMPLGGGGGGGGYFG